VLFTIFPNFVSCRFALRSTPDSWPVVAALLETSHSNEESSEWLVLQHKNPNWKIQLGIDIEHNTVQRLCISPTKNALRI